MAAVPGLRPGALPTSPGEALSKIIPKDELEKLNPSTLPLKTGVPGGLPLAGGVPAGGAHFQGVLSQMVSEVSAKQDAAGAAMSGVMSGSGVPLHQAMIAVEEASI